MVSDREETRDLCLKGCTMKKDDNWMCLMKNVNILKMKEDSGVRDFWPVRMYCLIAIVAFMQVLQVTAAMGEIENKRAWWSTGESLMVGQDVTTLVISKPREGGGNSLSFDNYLKNLLVEYAERGLRIIELCSDEDNSSQSGLIFLDPSMVPEYLAFPVAQVWRGEQKLLFDGSGRGIGLDTLHQLVKKHLGESDNNLSENKTARILDWFLDNWREIDFWRLADERRMEISAIDREEAAFLVIPGGCSKCALSRYENTISDFAITLDQEGRELIILIRNTDDPNIVNLVEMWGEVGYFTVPGDSAEALRTRYDKTARPFAFEISQEKGELTLVQIDEFMGAGLENKR